MRNVRFATLCLLCLAAASGMPAAAQSVVRDPERARIEVEDMRRLATVLRSIDAEAVSDTAALLEREYLAHASPGLRAYVQRYDVTGASIASALAAYPSLYADLDALADDILALQDTLRAAYRRLLELFPGAVFPTVWFVVGHNGPGGLTRPEGVLIAAERFARAPHDVVPLVMHELAHFQQAMVQGIDVYQRIFGPDRTLLAVSLREGSADLIAELTAGRHINPAAERYGLAHERALWSRFRREMHGRDTGDWLFVQPADRDVPPDLGYWIGYRIARRYYDQATDRRQAVLDILGLTDFTSFLAHSGYGRSVTK